MVRKILALVTGLAVAALLVMLVQKLGHSLYPPPDGMNPEDQEFLEKYVANLPWGPLALVAASYAVATLGGGLVASLIAGERPLLFSGLVALMVLAGAVSTMVTIPHPRWFAIAAVAGIVLAAWLAASLASTRGVRRRVV